jgi:hypothetical protein
VAADEIKGNARSCTGLMARLSRRRRTVGENARVAPLFSFRSFQVVDWGLKLY